MNRTNAKVLPYFYGDDNLIERRLFSRTKRVGECMVYGTNQSVKYPRIHIGDFTDYVHRISWSIANHRQVPPKLLVCHSCDVTHCINPAHLFIGTHKDNTADMDRKGRRNTSNTPHGEAHALSVLKERDILKIRKLHSKGYTCVRLAEMFSVTDVNISCIVRRKTWKHL